MFKRFWQTFKNYKNGSVGRAEPFKWGVFLSQAKGVSYLKLGRGAKFKGSVQPARMPERPPFQLNAQWSLPNERHQGYHHVVTASKWSNKYPRLNWHFDIWHFFENLENPPVWKDFEEFLKIFEAFWAPMCLFAGADVLICGCSRFSKKTFKNIQKPGESAAWGFSI